MGVSVWSADQTWQDSEEGCIKDVQGGQGGHIRSATRRVRSLNSNLF